MINNHVTAQSSSSVLDPRTVEVHTPLNIPAWRACLSTHPDEDFAHYILHGLQHGFHIGATCPLQLKSAKTNMATAKQHPEVFVDYIQRETEARNMFGPFPPQSTGWTPEC